MTSGNVAEASNSVKSPAGLTYSVATSGGGYDRIFVSVADAARGVCVQLILKSPSSKAVLPITAPHAFSVDSAKMFEGATPCSGAIARAGGVVATDGKGEITWPDPTPVVFPCTMNIHATVTFPAAAGRPSLTFQLDADRLVVRACPP
jgi:hypothetical protein